jgi:hypothetical protein
MNSEALKVAWFRMWNTAATAASGLFRPSSSGDQAQVADGRIGQQALQVVLEHRHIAPSSSVPGPDAADDPEPGVGAASTGHSRASRNTPALTMVAECR